MIVVADLLLVNISAAHSGGSTPARTSIFFQSAPLRPGAGVEQGKQKVWLAVVGFTWRPRSATDHGMTTCEPVVDCPRRYRTRRNLPPQQRRRPAEAQGCAAAAAENYYQRRQIAGIKDRLKLSASQESYWPPVETALRARRRPQNSCRPGGRRLRACRSIPNPGKSSS